MHMHTHTVSVFFAGPSASLIEDLARSFCLLFPSLLTNGKYVTYSLPKILFAVQTAR